MVIATIFIVFKPQPNVPLPPLAPFGLLPRVLKTILQLETAKAQVDARAMRRNQRGRPKKAAPALPSKRLQATEPNPNCGPLAVAEHLDLTVDDGPLGSVDALTVNSDEVIYEWSDLLEGSEVGV